MFEAAVDEIFIFSSDGNPVFNWRLTEDELRKAKLEAENSNKWKTAFIANMSQEIRTPIGVIIGFCELMLDENLHAKSRTDYLHRVIKNAKIL